MARMNICAEPPSLDALSGVADTADGGRPMRLYLVTDRTIARALLENLPLKWTHSLILDDVEDGTVRVSALVFYDFSWLGDLVEESGSDNRDEIVELVVDFPDEVVKPHEIACSEGGNSIWYLPQALVRRFIAQAATPGAIAPRPS